MAMYRKFIDGVAVPPPETARGACYHPGAVRFTVSLLVLFTAACASAPSVKPVTVAIPEITWAQKLGWMMRLEDQRLLRDPNPPARIVLAPATPGRPEILAPAEPTDIVALLEDPEARVRRRAALAAGRAGLPEATPALIALLKDQEFEVRQMAAFALGLLGDRSARVALAEALTDAHPIVQGRAAEALARLGQQEDGAAVAAMVRRHLDAGVVKDLQADDERVGQEPADAVRLGLLALGRLKAYDALASVVLGPDGLPVSSWWPFASALQQVGDPRAIPALRTMLATPSRYARTMAIQGLGALTAREAVPDLLRILTAVPTDRGLAVESLHALRRIGDGQAAPALLAVSSDGRSDPLFRLEAIAALGGMPPVPGTVDALLDLVSEADPNVRAAAFSALARVEPDSFISAIANMNADPHWTVRAAQAEALAVIEPARAVPALLARVQDPDQRVVARAIASLAATKSADVVATVTAALAAEDLVVRMEAARGLGVLGAPAAVAPLAKAWEAWRGEPHYQARVAALEALHTLDPQAARAPLKAALADRDWAVRVRALELLRALALPEGETAPGGPVIRPATASREIPADEWAWLLAPPFSPHARLELDRGTIELELDVTGAPQTVANFMTLARKGFFDGVPVHRVVTSFVVQAGDPRGDGEGGPGYTIRDELTLTPYLRGTVGMALDWQDTGGSQFFVTLGPQPRLDGRYTAFGRVVDGMAVVDQIQKGDVIRRVTVWDGREAR
jgi:HEAT repeat protein/cyclophilin family peptidyl-prolyl cis-trans isomerase